jgi:hypothetical protein
MAGIELTGDLSDIDFLMSDVSFRFAMLIADSACMDKIVAAAGQVLGTSASERGRSVQCHQHICATVT